MSKKNHIKAAALGAGLGVLVVCIAAIIAAFRNAPEPDGSRLLPQPPATAVVPPSETAPAPPAPKPPPPETEKADPVCLLSGRADDLRTLCRHLDELLVLFDPDTESDYLLKSAGRLIRNPQFSGVNLEAPIHFFILDPKTYPHPLVVQFKITNPLAVTQAAEAYSRAEGRGHLIVDGSNATWSLDPDAGIALRTLQEEGKMDAAFRAEGQLALRLHLSRIMTLFEKEIIAQTYDMKERMAEALMRVPDRAAAQREVAAAQAEIDKLLALLRQVEDIDLSIHVSRDAARLAMDIKPVANSLLAAAISAHPQASSDLFAKCPLDAGIVLAKNIDVSAVLRRMIARWLDARVPEFLLGNQPAEGGNSNSLTALFLPGDSQEFVGVLELCDGKRAQDALTRWQNLQKSGGGKQPVSLKPYQPAEPPIQGIEAAEIVFAETLDPGIRRFLQRILGPKPRAALLMKDERSISVAGQSPLKMIERVCTLKTQRENGLLSSPSLASVGHDGSWPNALVYVAPISVCKWLAMAGMRPEAPSDGELGFVGWLRFDKTGRLRAELSLPLAALREALPTLEREPSNRISPSVQGDRERP